MPLLSIWMRLLSLVADTCDALIEMNGAATPTSEATCLTTSGWPASKSWLPSTAITGTLALIATLSSLASMWASSGKP